MEPASRSNNRAARPINFFRQSTPATSRYIAGTGFSPQTVPCSTTVIVSADGHTAPAARPSLA
ncbi:MAG: hypothetical protein KDA79_08760 [Planctomycetaceae bacterium]|nr:hypothetical protein [Planctomycetaceae bacterium]